MEYQVKKYTKHSEVEKDVNLMASEGWAPIHYTTAPYGHLASNWHYVMFARRKTAE